MKSKNYKDFIKSQDKPIAFVLWIGGTGLGVIRSLGRRGIPVIGLDPYSREIGHFSRYCQGIVCPDPKTKEGEYVDFLLYLGEQLNTKGVLIPTSDVDVLAISKHREKLEKYYHFPMAKLDIIEKLVNKRIFYKTLDELDMPHPKTYFPNDNSDVAQISKEISYPCIIKPIFSYKSKFGAKVLKVNSEQELIKAFERTNLNAQEIVIQEVIPGSDTNMYLVGAYFNSASEPLGIFTFKRIRQYPRGFGNGALCASVWTPEIAKLCVSFLNKIKYHGIIDAELKKDPRDNKFKFIEINARTGWQNSLATRCGVNLPYMAYMDAIGQDVEKATSQRDDVKWVYMFDDLRSSFESMMERELSPIEYIKSLRGEKQYAIFAWDDPAPSFISLFNLGSSALRYLARHLISYVKLVTR